MTDASLYILARRLEGDVLAIVSDTDIADMPLAVRNTVASLKHQLADARLDVRDYELAETRAGQRASAKDAAKRLDAVHHSILEISEYNIIGAVDVARLTANIDRIKERLE